MANILFFDSGFGALSIIKDALPLRQKHSLHLCSDNGFFPYGEKPEESLPERVYRVLQSLETELDFDVLVIACNTASTVSLPLLREKLKQPVIGVVPAIKPAAAATESKHIGLLATPGTVSRAYTKQLIEDFAANCRVELLGSSELVQIAEDKLRGRTVNRERLREILSEVTDWQKQGMDQLVLGCTHFPLLEDELSELLPGLSLVDSGQAIVRQLERVLKDMPEKSDNQENTLCFTAPCTETVSQAIQKAFGFERVATLKTI